MSAAIAAIAALNRVSLPLADFVLNLDIAFPAGTTGLIGPSGSGKTSLLELLTGLRTPVAGAIDLHGRRVFDAETGIAVPAWERRIGYVPQDDTLFPHLSVRSNILYGSRAGEAMPADSLEHVTTILELSPLLDRRVQALSGGERKRIALARALLSDPKILLLDEPLGGIDTSLRSRVLAYLIRVRDELRVPMIYVTHEMEEVRILCSSMVVLNRGRVVDQVEVRG